METNRLRSIRSRLTKKTVAIMLLLLILVAGAGFAAMKQISDRPAFCASCHNMQSYYDSWNDSKLLAHQHARNGITCHDCHQASIVQQTEEGIKYVTGNYETPLAKREFPKEMCLKCHDFAKVKAKTEFKDSNKDSNPHDSHNGELQCNKCHSMHRESTMMCAKCHSFSWMRSLPDNWKKGK